MFAHDQLATLQIRHLIIHDVPNQRLDLGVGITFSETECELDARRINHLRKRMIAALDARSAYDIVFVAGSTSPVPPAVADITRAFALEQFVPHSQAIARYLYDQQFGTISSGLLAIMDAAIDNRNALIVLKIERQEGLQLALGERDGKPTFSISVLDNLVLTEGTRLFKLGVFRRTGDNDFEGVACDSQKTVNTADDVAKFWLRFLGCDVSEKPRVRTTRFFETVVTFINDVVTNAITKNDLYEHLVSELKAQRRVLSPRNFMEEYVPRPLRLPFSQHFEGLGVPMTQFSKDLEDIRRKISRKSWITEHGVSISVPTEEEELVQIREEQIVVNDSLRRVGGRR